MSRLFHFLKQNILIALALLIAAIIIGRAEYLQNRKPDASTVRVTRGTITQVVSVTGTVKPAAAVDLAFERSGKIGRVFAQVSCRAAYFVIGPRE